MTSEPISLLPAGSPGDALLFAQSTGAAGVTQKITQLQYFRYISAKSANNTVYVSGTNGVDTVGNGNVLAPYASLSYALSQITNATETNYFTIIIDGGTITDSAGQIKLKPYINIKGQTQGTFIENSSNIILDTVTWNANPNGSFYIEDVTITGVTSLDFSFISSSSTPFIKLDKLYGAGNLFIMGGGHSLPEIISFDGLYNNAFFDNCFVTSLGDSYAVISCATISQSIGMGVEVLGGVINTFVGNGLSTGAFVWDYSFYSVAQIASLSANGSKTTLFSDASSIYGVTPTLTNGAKIIPLDEAQNIFASSTRANYTPTSPTVEGNLQGIDAALGAVGALQLRRFVDSFSGSDSTGTGSIEKPWKTITHALASITDATSLKIYNLSCSGVFSEANLNLKGYINIDFNNSTLTLSGIIGIDSSWPSGGATAFVKNISSFNAVGVDMNFSTKGATAVYFRNIETSNAQTWNLQGTASSFYELNNIYTQFGVTPINFTGINSKGRFLTSLLENLNIQNVLASNVITIDMNGTDVTGTIQTNCDAAGAALTVVQNGGLTEARTITTVVGTTQYFVSSEIDDGTTNIVGANSFLISTGLNNIPVFSGGATYAVNFIPLRSAIGMRYDPTPVNYTAANKSVEAQITGIDNALGSVAIPAATNAIFVSQGGNDLTGTGSIIAPFASISQAIAYAFSLNPTSANPYMIIIMGGDITDSAGQISLIPFVSLQGYTQGTIINNSNDIIVNAAAFQALGAGSLFIQDVNIQGNINFDFSSVTATGASEILFNNIEIIGTLNILGSATYTPLFYTYISNYYECFFDNTLVNFSVGNIYTAVVMGLVSTIAANSFNSSSDIIYEFGAISSSVASTHTITNCQTLSVIIIENPTTTLNIDASSLANVTPTITNGAILNTLDKAQNVYASDSRTNYTPASPDVEGNLQGIDDALGAVTLPCLKYLGKWNAITNSPTIMSGVGTEGDFYIVGNSGTTTIDGNNVWFQNDWIYFNGTAWVRVNLTDFDIMFGNQLTAIVLETNNLQAQFPIALMQIGYNLTAGTLALGSTAGGNKTDIISPIFTKNGGALKGALFTGDGTSYNPIAPAPANDYFPISNSSAPQGISWNNNIPVAFTPVVTIIHSAFSSVVPQQCFYTITGKAVNIVGTLALNFTNGGVPPSISGPVFVFSVPQNLAAIFGASTRYFLSESDIYNIGFVSNQLGLIEYQSSSPLPQASIVTYLTQYNQAVLTVGANSPFFVNFNFTYYMP